MRSTTKLTLSAAALAAAAALFGFEASRPGASPERDPRRAAIGEAVGDAGREAIGDAGTALAKTPTSPTDEGPAGDGDAEPDPAVMPPAPAPARPAPAADAERSPDPRAPIVRAIRASYARELDRRDAMVRELAASGPSREPWTRGVGAAFDHWLREVASEGLEAPHVGEPRCFTAGCAAALTFADRATADAFAERVRKTPSDWAGGRVLTPPEELASGEVLVTWMLLRPDGL